MGSTSDWETMKNASDILTEFDVAHECKVVSAHRTPDLFFEFAKSAEAARHRSHHRGRGRRGASAGNVRVANRSARSRCSRSKQGSVRVGFAFINRSNARRNSGRNFSNRKCGREKRRAFGNFDSGKFAHRFEKKIKKISEESNKNGFGFRVDLKLIESKILFNHNLSEIDLNILLKKVNFNNRCQP